MPIYLFFFYSELNECYEFVGSCANNEKDEFSKKVDELNNLMHGGSQKVVIIHTYLGKLAINNSYISW